jgi:hypothetical protein
VRWTFRAARVRSTICAKFDSERSNVVLDTAEFTVEDVPTLQARAFRRQVQLMVTLGRFRFS